MTVLLRLGLVMGLALGTAAGQDTGSVPPRPMEPARISGGVMAGAILTKVNPVYPADAKVQGIEGSVVLHAIIGRDGMVQNLLVISGNELLAQAAVDAVKQWTYRPYLLNGVATEVDTTVTVNFRLGPGPSAPSTPPSPSSSMPSGPVRVSGGVMAGMLLHRVPLAYPEEAKARGIQGRVVLMAIIGKDGRVIHLQAISGDPSLQQSALDAVKDWVYRPYLLNGEPIEVDTNITCDFTISG